MNKWNDETSNENKDGDRNNMQKMSISTRANESTLLEKTTDVSFLTSASQFSSFILESQIGRFIGLFFLLLLLYVLFSLQTDKSSYQPGSRENNSGYERNKEFPDERQINIRPKRLYDLISTATILAKKAGSLSSLSMLAPEYITDKSLEFLVFLHDISPQPKQLNRLISDSDPFSKNNIDPNLFISVIPPSYSLLLNKFNTIDRHTLLITNEYIDQSTPLNEFDLEVWYWCIGTYMYIYMYYLTSSMIFLYYLTLSVYYS
jgi:Ca2+/Na+ antiporter